MSLFLPQLWDKFLDANHGDQFWPEFNKLQNHFQECLRLFMARPVAQRDARELSQLWTSTQRWVQLEMSFDMYARGESYTLPRVPFSKTTQQFMSYARTQDPSYCEGLMNRYWLCHQRA